MYEWNEAYAIGVERIDKAHQDLFTVINRVQKMSRQGGNLKWAVVESVKFFRIYAINHFSDEEAFMREIGYTGLANHKAVHDGMRDRILPRVYSELEYTQYAEDSVNRYLQICYKWLDRHILGHDRELIKWVDESSVS